MRIAHVVTRFRRGGTERNIRQFAAWQRDHGHEVVLVVGHTSLDELVPDGVPVIHLASLRREPNPRHDVAALTALRRLLAPVDLVHTHESKAGILGRLAAPRRATVAHTVHMPSFGPAFGGVSPLYRACERLVARRTDWMIAVSGELRTNYLTAGIGRPDRFVVLHSPARVEDLLAVRDRSPSDRAAARSALRLPPDGPVVLSAGSLEPRKRIDLAIRRLAQPLREGAMVLAVAGAGAERSALEHLVGELGLAGRVHLLGQVDRIEQAMTAADVFVQTSRTEGLAQVLIQSLAAGLPVVSTPVEGIGEFPGAPIRVVAGDGAGLAEAVRAALVDDRPPMPIDGLTPWRTDAVNDGIATFHQTLESAPLRARTQRLLPT